MDRKIRVLVVTYLPWRDDNNIGNSYSNIFKGMENKIEFAHIYIRNGLPQNGLVKECYHISITRMISRFFKWNIKVGEKLEMKDFSTSERHQFSLVVNWMKILRWPFFLLAEEIVGLSKSWETKDLEVFIDDFNPDIVFGTLPDNALISNIMLYIKNRRNIPLVTYPWDDYYSLNHSNWDPCFWLRKLLQRHYLRKTAKQSEYLYVISDLMREEYIRIFKKDCRLLFKGHKFEKDKVIKVEVHTPINLVYMGNIGQGRWKTLANIASAIKEINAEAGKDIFYLNIYTLSPKNKKMMLMLDKEGCSKINEAVSIKDVPLVMGTADILLHVEPFKKSEYQFYRASFTTKLVDYFYAGKCILAVGGLTASTGYLRKYDAAICILKKEEIKSILFRIASSPDLIRNYAQKAWECGVRNHQIIDIQERVYNDFKVIVKR